MRLKNQVCLVTGGGSGIGKATAVLMGAEGARVAVLSRTEDEVKQTAEEIRAAGGEAIHICADISKAEDMERTVREVIAAFGRLDVVFANAGVNGVWGPIEDLNPDDWDKTIAINLRGTFLTIKYAVPHLKKRGGSIVVTASINGTRVFSNSGATAYAATKAAQVAMVKMLALELAAHKIRVNVVCPGAIETEIQENTDASGAGDLGVRVEFPDGWHPLKGEPGKSDQVAKMVVFLASSDADHITGTEMYIDGGESLLGIHG
jgi:NAD(P)-dependent dehydrogenase (short-subunit alcohol dehydrogenase family)